MNAGNGILELSHVAGETAVTRIGASNPLKLLAPRSRGHSAWIYSTSFGGGMLAGDEINLTIRSAAATRCFLSTQSATKIYRSPLARPARHNLHAAIGDDALLIVAPDPVQCFADSIYEQRQRFDLAPSAGLVLLDWLSSGRHARGERWAFTRYRSRNDIFIGNDHLLCDSLLLDPSDGPLDAPFRVGRFDCLAVVALVGEPLRKPSEELLAEVAAQPVERQNNFLCAASPLRRGALLRVAGDNSETVGRFLRQKLGFIRDLLGDDPWERKW